MRYLKKGSICIFAALLVVELFTGSSFAAHTITNWPDNKVGAVSLTFDDSLPSQISLGIPALNARGMKGTFFVITNNVAGDWDPWKNASLMGHEIGSHTMSHPYLTTLTPSQVQVELQESQAIIDNQIATQKAVTIAYPYGDYNSSVQSIAQNYYISARGVYCGLNQDPYDFYNVRACSPDSLDNVYAQTDAAEQQGKWMVFFIHSLDGTGYGDWLIGDLQNYLDYLMTKNLWVGTFGSMVKYIKERQSSNLFVSSATASQIVLNLTDTLDDTIFGEPLTIRSEIPGNWTNVTVLQGASSTTVASVLEGGVRVIYYHAIPNRGSITLTSSALTGNGAPNGVIDTPLQNVTINIGDVVSFAGTGTDPDGNLPLGYRWSFGAGSGIPDVAVEDPGGKQFNNPGIYTVSFTVTDSLGLSDPTPATRVVSVLGNASDPFLEDGTGLVSMEAEHYQSNVPVGAYAWMPVTNSGYSGTGALQVLPDDSPDPLMAGAGPRLDYQVQFTQTGTHYVWIRALAHSYYSDSLYVGLDGGTSGAVYMAGLAVDGLTWTWSRQTASGPLATVTVPSAGVHTVNVWMRESGVVLDKLVLTSSSSYVPTGTGPAESASTVAVAPTVVTNSASSVTTAGGVLNGGVNPNGLATTGWFEWGTSPTLATFSSTSSQSLGSGTTSQAIAATLSGLTTGTTYYFRVAASNSAGPSKGSIASFSPAAPGGFLQDGTGLVSMEAEHYQSNVPLGAYAWMPVANTGYSGTGALQVLPNDEPNPLIAGAGPRLDYQVQFTQTGTHYVWIRALGYSGASDSMYVGLDGGTSSAVYMAGLAVDGLTWRWSRQTGTGSLATVTVTSVGVHTVNVWMRESGVVLDKLVLASNSSYTPTGTGPSETLGAASIAPTVVTNAASSVTTTGGVLNGGVNPNGLATTGWFEWGTSPTLATFSSTSSQSLGSGTTSQAIAATLSGLTTGTTYYFRVAASNSAGPSKGSIASFSTTAAAVAPTVVTNAASSVTTTGGVLNGGVNPNGLATNGWFEWGTSSSLASFSTTSTQSMGSGTSSQAVAATLSGLASGTTYYFRVAASNSAGTSKGSIASFTPAAPGGFLQDGTGLVSMEAEHYQSNTPLGGYAWTPVANSGYSGTGALQVLPNDGPDPLAAGAGPRLDYQVQFTQTGTHYVWIRALGYSGASDSLYVGLDGGTSGAVYMAGLSQDGLTWTWSRKAGTGLLATVTVPSVGVHTVNVWMRESGVVLDKLVLTSSSSYVPTGTGPAETVSSEYVAVGDSITAGSHDDIPSDGIGYEPILATMLAAAKGYPISVANEGISGATSADGVVSISTVLAKYPTARYFLVMYGTNDAFIPALPSGSGLLPGDPGYSGSYKDNMQKIISAILAAGKTPYLAEVPYTTDPLLSNAMIFEYNAAVDELFVSNGITVTPPPFYAYFQAHPGELADGIHPNGTGYQSMGFLWFDALPK